VIVLEIVALLTNVISVILSAPAFTASYRETFLEFRGRSLALAGSDIDDEQVNGL
jgi:hypothetical protein